MLKESVAVDVQRFHYANFLVASACNLPFKEGVFDLTLCFEVIEHIEHHNQALREMGRVTKETILITTPHKIASFYRLFHKKEFEVEKFYSLKDLEIPKGWALRWKRSIWYSNIALKRVENS